MFKAEKSVTREAPIVCFPRNTPHYYSQRGEKREADRVRSKHKSRSFDLGLTFTNDTLIIL